MKRPPIVRCKTKGTPITLCKVSVARKGKTSATVRTPTKRKRAKTMNDIMKVVAGSGEEDEAKQTAANLKALSEEKRAAVLKFAAVHQVRISAKTSSKMRATLLMSWAKQRKLRQFARAQGIKFPSERKEREFQKNAMMGKIRVSMILLKFYNKRQDRQVYKKSPVVDIEHLPTFVSNLLDSYDEKKALVWPTNIPENEIWIKIGGDHGGGSFKLALQIANLQNPNSSSSTHLIQIAECKDSASNLHTLLFPLKQRLEDLKKLKWKEKKIRVFLCGDYDFLLKMYGISGAQSTFPCLWCYASKEDSQQEAKEQKRKKIQSRSLNKIQADYGSFREAKCPKEQAKCYHNVTTPPIWGIELDHVTPPQLHILLGLVKKHHDILEDDCHNLDKQLAMNMARKGTLPKEDDNINPDFRTSVMQIKSIMQKHPAAWLEKIKEVEVFDKKSGPITQNLEKVLAKHNIEPQAYHSGAFIGNHCNKYLETPVYEDLTSSIVTETERLTDDADLHKSAKYIKDSFFTLNELFSKVHKLISHCRPIDEQEVLEIDRAIKQYMQFYRMRFLHRNRVIPKQHMLEVHCVNWIKKWGCGMGLLGEQGIEQLHSTVNQLKRRTWGMRRTADSLRTQMTEALFRTSPAILESPGKENAPERPQKRCRVDM